MDNAGIWHKTPEEWNRMARKIVITILAGGLYWLFTSYMVTAIFPPENIIHNYNFLRLIYFVIPFLFGSALLILFKEKSYVGIIYSAMIIVVRYIITLIEVTIRHPAGPSAVEQTFFLFKLMGYYSMACSTLGGMLGVFLNKKVFNK